MVLQVTKKHLGCPKFAGAAIDQQRLVSTSTPLYVHSICEVVDRPQDQCWNDYEPPQAA